MKENKKVEIKVKKIGKNLITTIDGKQYVKVINDKDAEETPIRTKVEMFNKRNSETKKKEIIDLFDKKGKEKEIKDAKKKGIKKAVKKAAKTNKKEAAVGKKVVEKKKTAIGKTVKEKLGKLVGGLKDKKTETKLEEKITENKEVTKEQPKSTTSTYRRSGEW